MPTTGICAPVPNQHSRDPVENARLVTTGSCSWPAASWVSLSSHCLPEKGEGDERVGEQGRCPRWDSGVGTPTGPSAGTLSCGRLVADFQSLSSRIRVQRGNRMEIPSAV